MRRAMGPPAGPRSVLSHLLVLGLLLYLTADFVDPSVPGVFFFDSDTLFLETVVQSKSAGPVHRLAPPPTSGGFEAPPPDAATRALVATASPVRPLGARHRARSHVPWHASSRAVPTAPEDH